MVDRQDFEHQKLITQEAYLFGIMNRIDFNFIGIVESFADLPLTGNVTNDAYYVRNNISNWVYIWNGAAWVKDTAGGSAGGINYTSFPVSIGNRLIISVGLNADFVNESAIEVDSAGNMTFPDSTTHTYSGPTGVTITGIQNFDTNYVGNYTSSILNFRDSTLNFDNTVSNYTNGSITNYDVTTTVNMLGTANITNLTVTNLSFTTPPTSGGFVGAETIASTANYTVLTTDDLIYADATANSVQIDLYTAVGNAKRKVTIKRIDSTANTVAINPSGAQTIDGSSANYLLANQWNQVSLVSNGTNRFIIY